jgi:hypothetical protein
MQAPRNPSETQLRMEAALARKKRLVLTRIIPARTRTPIKMKRKDRRI